MTSTSASPQSALPPWDQNNACPFCKHRVSAGPEGLSIGDRGSRTDMICSALIHQAKILAQAGIVEQVRKGLAIICAAVAFDRIRHVSEFLLTECCADSTTPCEDNENG